MLSPPVIVHTYIIIYKRKLIFHEENLKLNWEPNLESLAFQANMQNITPLRFKF
jgi:hypothetical protein